VAIIALQGVNHARLQWILYHSSFPITTRSPWMRSRQYKLATIRYAPWQASFSLILEGHSLSCGSHECLIQTVRKLEGKLMKGKDERTEQMQSVHLTISAIVLFNSTTL